MKVFISYSSKESEKALHIRNVLTSNGFECWMAPESIPAGSNYAKEIPNAIASCGAFVLVLSKYSQESIYVSKEVNEALSKGKTIIPFHIDSSDMNSEFNFFLNNVQRIDAYDRMSKAYEVLVKTLCAMERPPRTPPEPIIIDPNQPRVVIDRKEDMEDDNSSGAQNN